jgi:hypothetical protein
MRLFILAFAVAVPSIASAQTINDVLNTCPSFKEQADMTQTVGTGADAIQKAVTFYYGNPKSKKSMTNGGVALTWPTRTITLTLGAAGMVDSVCQPHSN